MQFSGYPQKYRYEVLSKAMRKDKQWRERQQQQQETEDGTTTTTRRKQKKGRDWYDKTKYDGVMFVDVTPDSELQHRVQDACKKNGVKVVIEKINQTVKKKLQKSNPYGWKHCGRSDGPTCEPAWYAD